MNVEKDRKKLREFYNKQANFEPTRGDESYMSHIWEEFNKMKKPLEERVCREFKEIFNETFPWIFRDENICPKAIYDAHFDNFEIKIKNANFLPLEVIKIILKKKNKECGESSKKVCKKIEDFEKKYSINKYILEESPQKVL